MAEDSAIEEAIEYSNTLKTIEHLRDQETSSGLLPAEDALLLCAVSGTQCTLGDGSRPERVSEDRRVRGSFLRFLALGGDGQLRVHETGVWLSGAYIDGELDLSGVRCKVALALTNCWFETAIRLHTARLSMLKLDGSRVAGVRGDLMRIDGGIFLQDGFLAHGSVRFYTAQIGGDLDCRGGIFSGGEEALLLTGAHIAGSLHLGSCRVEGRLRLPDARIGGSLDASGATVINKGGLALYGNTATIGGSVRASGATIDGNVNMVAASVGGELDASDAKVAGIISLRNTNIGGDVNLTRLSVTSERTDRTPSLNIVSSVIRGSIYLSGVSVDSGVAMDGVDVHENIHCHGGLFKASTGNAISLISAKIGGSVLLCQVVDNEQYSPRVTVIGGINLSRTRIGGNLECTGGRIDGRGSVALNCASTDIRGSVALDRHWDERNKRNEVGERIFMVSEPFSATGEVTFYSATIAGALVACTGGEFKTESGNALDFSNAKITGDVLLDADVIPDGNFLRFQANGTVNFYGAEIAGTLNCSGGQFTSTKEEPLSLNCTIAKIGGGVFLNQVIGPRFTSVGEVRFSYAKIGLTLECVGASIINSGGIALNCNAVQLGSGAFLTRSSSKAINRSGFESEGEVNFTSARIAHGLQCEAAHFKNLAPNEDFPKQAANALNLSGARIEGSLNLGVETPDKLPATVEGSINLASAYVRELVDHGFFTDESRFPRQVTDLDGTKRSSVIVLDGFVCERFGGRSATDARTRIAWLKRQPESHLSREAFRPQPFEQLTAALRATGHERDARRISIYKQQRLTRLTPFWIRVVAIVLIVGICAATRFNAVTESVEGWLLAGALLCLLYFIGGIGWLGRVVLGLLAGYGYKPGRILVLAILLGVGFALIVQQAAQQGAFVPKDVSVARELKCGPDWTRCSEHPLIPLVYSFDTMLPLKLGHADQWSPQRKAFQLSLVVVDWPMPEWVLQTLIWAEILFGWIASGIILALVSGFLKRD